MEKEYFYLNGETRIGPLSLEALKSAPITPATLVWNNTLPDWVEARTLPELTDVFMSGHPSPPTTPRYNVSNAAGGGFNNPDRPPMPENYLVWAILTTVLCCLPLGIVSIINATKVSSTYNMGDYQGAQKASADAKKWATIGAITGGVGIILYIILVFGLGLAGAFANL